MGLEMTIVNELNKDKEFFRLKKEYSRQLWDILVDAEYTQVYHNVVDVLVDGMNESFKVGSK